MNHEYQEFLLAQTRRDCGHVKHYAETVHSRANSLSKLPDFETEAEAEMQHAELALTEALLAMKVSRARLAEIRHRAASSAKSAAI